MRRFLRRSQSGQASMVEITATLLLLSLVMTVVYSSVDAAQQAITGEAARITNLDEARTLMAVTTKDLRTATRLQAGTSPFVSAQARDVNFYANLNNTAGGPRKIRIYIDPSNTLIASVWSPDLSSVAPNYTYTGPSSLRYVGQYVNNAVGQAIFEYYDINNLRLTAPLSAANLLAVYSVQVTLVVRKQTTLPVRSVTLVNQVRLPNVDYQPPGS